MTKEQYSKAGLITHKLTHIEQTLEQISRVVTKDNALYSYNDDTILMKVKNLLTEDLMRAKRDLEIEFNNI